MIKHYFPHPFVFVILGLIWLLLAQSLAGTTIIMACIASFGLCHLLKKLDPPSIRIKHIPTALNLSLRVFMDIARSNLNVARMLAKPAPLAPQSSFVTIPLSLTHPQGLAMLACIITSTPGTVWVTHNSERQYLIIHVLDASDKDAVINTIKQRYEKPLMEIFQ